ncbi:type II toxin-antitoxin system HicB family antitoxin [Vibrio breoganii]|uniref:type II toxin-antitoxin system HicB family antitoxin n=1 Tax=Vibrio breoganii TaxID=553239 RepID=UPI000CB4760D|nr:type II toxin-antitoxin system HicB family antitoxin [Vibrio breoganii]PML12767.1 hypothetical protein BCT84_02460 [Vibrio breoganii]
MNYLVGIQKSKFDNTYSARFPDLIDCKCEGITINETLVRARRYLNAHLNHLVSQGKAPPRKKPIQQHLLNNEYKNAFWVFVEIEKTPIHNTNVIESVSIPLEVVNTMDDHIDQNGRRVGRNKFIVDAIEQRLRETH